MTAPKSPTSNLFWRPPVTHQGGGIYAGGGDTPEDDGTGAASNNQFYVTVLLLPEAACETIAAEFLNRSNVVGINVEGTWGTALTQVDTTAVNGILNFPKTGGLTFPGLAVSAVGRFGDLRPRSPADGRGALAVAAV